MKKMEWRVERTDSLEHPNNQKQTWCMTCLMLMHCGLHTVKLSLVFICGSGTSWDSDPWNWGQCFQASDIGSVMWGVEGALALEPEELVWRSSQLHPFSRQMGNLFNFLVSFSWSVKWCYWYSHLEGCCDKHLRYCVYALSVPKTSTLWYPSRGEVFARGPAWENLVYTQPQDGGNWLSLSWIPYKVFSEDWIS